MPENPQFINDSEAEDTTKVHHNCHRKKFLFTYMKEIIDRLRESGQIATANNYYYALNSFKQFQCCKDLTISSIDGTILEEYQSYLKRKGLMRNSISFYMRILRAVYNRAVRQGFTTDRHPFENVFTGMEKTRKRAISSSEIKRISHLDLADYPTLDFTRDVFVFLFLCRGMSFIDAAFLKKSNIINGIIVYRRHKTGQQLYIKIVDQIKSLLAKYAPSDSPFLLPIITNSLQDEHKQYRTALRMINKSLKTIGKMAGINTLLTTYVSRHSWATIAKTKNIPLPVISDALGHESLLTTQIYLDSIGASAIDRANEIVIRGL